MCCGVFLGMKAEHKTLFDCDMNWTFAKLCSEICEKKNIVIDENMFDSKPSAYVGSCDGFNLSNMMDVDLEYTIDKVLSLNSKYTYVAFELDHRKVARANDGVLVEEKSCKKVKTSAFAMMMIKSTERNMYPEFHFPRGL